MVWQCQGTRMLVLPLLLTFRDKDNLTGSYLIQDEIRVDTSGFPALQATVRLVSSWHEGLATWKYQVRPDACLKQTHETLSADVNLDTQLC